MYLCYNDVEILYVKTGVITTDLIRQQLSWPIPSDHGGTMNANGLHNNNISSLYTQLCMVYHLTE